MDADVPDDVDDHWEGNSIKMLLNLYMDNIDKFRNKRMRKKNLWVNIATAVGKSPDSCDKKFRNLKQTYLRLLKKRSKSECGFVKWPYFDVFEQIYNINGEYQQEIVQKLQDNTTENVTKALLTLAETSKYKDEERVSGVPFNSRGEDTKKTFNQRRFTDFKRVTLEMKNRQKIIEEKLDRLLYIVQESNDIQRERNRMFQQFLDGLQQNTT